MNIATVGILSAPPAAQAGGAVASPPAFELALNAAMKPAAASPLAAAIGAAVTGPSPAIAEPAGVPTSMGVIMHPASAAVPEAPGPIDANAPSVLVAAIEPPHEAAAVPALAVSKPTEQANPAADASPKAVTPTDTGEAQLPHQSHGVVSADNPAAERPPEVTAEPTALREHVAEQIARPPVDETVPSAIPVQVSLTDAPPPPQPAAMAVMAVTIAPAQQETFDPEGEVSPSPSAEAASPEVPAPPKAKPEFSGAIVERAYPHSDVRAATTETSVPVEAARSDPNPVRTEGLTSSLLSQSLPAASRAAPADLPYAPASGDPVVNARPGQIGREMGVEIVRRLSAGKDEMLIRLNPQEMGRIEVRMSFDEGGSLRAVVTAESPAALEMLRRDAGELGRTLTDAGVRADPDSFRFGSRGGDGGQGWQGRHESGEGRRQGDPRDGQPRSPDTAVDAEPAYRRLRASGQIDLMA